MSTPKTASAKPSNQSSSQRNDSHSSKATTARLEGPTPSSRKLGKLPGPEGLTLKWRQAREEDQQRECVPGFTADNRLVSVLNKVEPAIRAGAKRAGIRGPDVDDVQQLVHLALLKKLRRPQPTRQTKGARLVGFAYTAAKFKGFDAGRRKRSACLLKALQLDEIVDSLAAQARTPDAEAATDDLHLAVLEAYRKLATDPKRRLKPVTLRSFSLTVLEHYSPSDAAKLLNIKTAAVYLHKKRVIDALRELMLETQMSWRPQAKRKPAK